MKKVLMTAICIATLSGISYGMTQTPEKKVIAKKIADGYEGANGPCRTSDGQRGTLYPNTMRETTSSGSSSSNTYNNSNTRSNSVSGTVGVTKLEGALSTSSAQSSGRSNTNTVNNQNSREIGYICVPNNKRK